ncbi:hypothetical protein D3C73_1474170 [compost metagenome]
MRQVSAAVERYRVVQQAFYRHTHAAFFAESAIGKATFMVFVAGNGFAEQQFFRTERFINTRRGNAQLGDQIRHGGAFIPLTPEEIPGLQ